MKNKIVYGLLIVALSSFHAFAAEQAEIATGVISAKNAKIEMFDWGRMMTYYAGESYSATDSLSAVAIINPGMQIHPPHVHSEEEYLMVLEGSGTWTVEGEDFPAHAGDMLYAAPWDSHGVKNTGDTPLSFMVFKWNPKPVEPLPEPKKDK